MLVVGSASSSNSNRLREVAEQGGAKAKLIDGPDDIDPAWLVDCERIGVTAGASAPEIIVQQVVQSLQQAVPTARVLELDGVQENVNFAVPKNLLKDVPLRHT